METVVTIIMFLVVLTFLLKLACQPKASAWITCGILGLLTALAWPYAIEGSRTQIADWLADSSLMLDIAVLLTADIMLQMAFCLDFAVGVQRRSTTRAAAYGRLFLRFVPGLLIFGVLFSLLTAAIFSFPGVDFALLGWSVGAGVAVLLPLLAVALRSLLPSARQRVESMFLVSALTGCLGVVATVNGRTAVAGVSSFDTVSLLAVVGLLFGALCIGLAIHYLRKRIIKIISL